MDPRSFTVEQKEVLRKEFDDGLQSSSKSNSLQICQLASKLGCTEQKIKNFIGNERRKRKSKQPQKPPQKLRCPNGYNIFTKEFRQSEDAKKLTLAEQNKRAAVLWHELSDDDKGRYYSASKAGVATTEVNQAGYPQAWKEVKRILNNMQINCQYAEKLDIQCCFMVTHGANHYVGGTQYGRDFLENNLHLPILFLSDVQNSKAKSNHESTSTISELRKKIHKELNSKYSLTTGDPTSKISYTEINANQVVGWPQFVSFCHPNNLSISELEKVSSAMKEIKFKPAATVTTEARHSVAVDKKFDHTYCKLQGPLASFNQAVEPLPTGSTSLLESSGIISTNDQYMMHTIDAGKKVKLTYHGRIVGVGTVIDGTVLHGMELPTGFVKVVVDEIHENITPLVKGKFSDDFIGVGEIHGWPVEDVMVE